MIPELTSAFALTTLGVSSLLGLYYYTYAGFAIVALKRPLIFQTAPNTAAATLFSMNRARKRSMSARKVCSVMFGMAS